MIIIILSVLSVGGDGMLSEIINGMLRYRDGSHEVVKSSKDKPLIIGIIPAGKSPSFLSFGLCILIIYQDSLFNS